MTEYQTMIREIARKMVAELEIEIMLKLKSKEFLETNFLDVKRETTTEKEQDKTEKTIGSIMDIEPSGTYRVKKIG